MSVQASHGVRTVENLRKYCGITDPEELEVRYLVYAALRLLIYRIV